MTILATDIALLESERMTDTTDGGGRRTSREIPDGEAGNVFPKVSHLDGVYGRVNVLKIYGAVLTGNADTYAGARAYVSLPPQNDKVHIKLFSTGSEFDTRSAARDRIESYVTAGPESRMFLLGKQPAGTQLIRAYQRLEDPLPEVGDVYCLSTEVDDTVTAEQYIQVTTVSSDVQTFTETIGSAVTDFQRRVIYIGVGTPLRYDFRGADMASQLSSVPRPTRLRSTTYVDAARYYGIQPLAAPAAPGDLTVRAASVYSPIVPASKRETPLANLSPASAAAMVPCRASARTETMMSSGGWAVGASYRTLRGMEPGSVSVTGAGVSAVDDGLGNISSAEFTATVDYEMGVVKRTGGSVSVGAYDITYRPAVRAAQIAHTRMIEIDLATRGISHVATLLPLPAPGATTVDYRALNKWYRLQDRGDGTLTGDDSAYGSAILDYTTGSLLITLGALPDLDSAIIISWGARVHYAVRAGAASDAAATVKQRFVLQHLPAAPGSLALTYESDGVEYTAADDGNGAIAGGGVAGTINYTTGETTIEFSARLPDALSSVHVDYDQLVASTPGEQVVRSISLASGALMELGASIDPGTLTGSVRFDGAVVYVEDNGGGLLIAPAGQALGSIGRSKSLTIASDQVVGTVNYGVGTVVVNTPLTVTGQVWSRESPNPAGAWIASAKSLAVGGGIANFGWADGGVATTATARTDAVSFSAAPLRFSLRTTIGDNFVPNSVLLNIAGVTYIDRSGTLYADVSSATGAGISAGSIDYGTGELALSWWIDGALPTIALDCALSIYGEYSAVDLHMRTAGAPLRAASFAVQATSESGEVLTGAANNSGVVSGSMVRGTVNQDAGVAFVEFGQLVAAAGNEAEWWYDAAAVVGGMIWRPEPVIPSSIRYNAVVLANLPLNADLLGLDPVRLPTDGRVPVFRPSDVVVVHNTQPFELPAPAAAGAVYAVGRTDLADIWIEDQTGKKVDGAMFVPSLIGGSVTMAPAGELDLTGYVEPLIVMHRVENMRLIVDVQLNGDLTLLNPLDRVFPTDGSYVSSALLFGDMMARVSDVRDLLAWSGNWDDVEPGAIAEYNVIDYPVEVLNNGAIAERWRLAFTSQTTFQVIGKSLGVIATGSTAEDCAPVNQLTSQPYFVLRAAGWGSGWLPGNNLMFTTAAPAAPIWIARTVEPGASVEGDSFRLNFAGDVDG
jgi:hypothetical protein